MASLNQITSEIVHAVGQPNNHALRENVKAAVVHTRNEVIRHSVERHNFLDAGLQQTFRVTVSPVEGLGDGHEPTLPFEFSIRTVQKVPRPVRLTNNLPFMRVSTTGSKFNQEIPYIKETAARFRFQVPGLRGVPCYDYRNDYIYIYTPDLIGSYADSLNEITISAAFEHPTAVKIAQGEGNKFDFLNDDDEWFISEDMIGQIKDIVIKRELIDRPRENDEQTPTLLTK